MEVLPGNSGVMGHKSYTLQQSMASDLESYPVASTSQPAHQPGPADITILISINIVLSHYHTALPYSISLSIISSIIITLSYAAIHMGFT